MPALTPALALRYLAELEPGLEAVAIAAADGTTLAGDVSLTAPLAPGSGDAARVLTAHSPGYLVIARVAPGTLEELVRHDLEAVARELG